MSKRPAPDDGLEASPSKRPHVEGMATLSLDDGDDDFTVVQTPSSMVDPDSPVTAATTPRTRFPSDLKTLACTWPGCPKSFNRPARLRDHLNSHTNSRPFRCPYDDCDKDYIEDKHLKQHVKAAHTHDRKYICHRDGCTKSFVTGTRLKRHQAVHDGADRFRCQTCGQSFRKKETLHKHVRKDHLHKPAFECPEPACQAAFDSKPALKRHREKLHGPIKFWCLECGSKAEEDGTGNRVGFTTELLLQQHLKQEHQNCIFCDFKSSSKWDLEHHVEMHHSGKTVEDRKTHACTHPGCGKRFTKRSNLNTHVRTAHEGFRFVCGDVDFAGPGFEAWSYDQACGDKFSTKARLEEHVRFIHLGQERPKLSRPGKAKADRIIDDISGTATKAKQVITCPHCDEKFKRYHDLNLHTARDHGPSREADAGVVRTDALFPEPSSFGLGDAQSVWSDQLPQEETQEEELFAAQMDYGPPQDDWQEDEANILLLARDPPGTLECRIDPFLAC
ncbi:hypothetical protein RJ55_03078 [Drechmeria coniospora]|nr:hypothetical protein RJ55_03078 [Drechmeria coniospora]